MTSSIILCLQNTLGQDTPVAVDPEDDFHTFMERARSVLGKDLDISSITGGDEVSLTDNVYQFILRSQVIMDSESLEPNFNNFQSESQQLEDLAHTNDDEETVYVLSDAHVLYNNSDRDEIMAYSADNHSFDDEGIQLDSGDFKYSTFSYKCIENDFENQTSDVPKTFEIVDSEISYYGDGNSEKVPEKNCVSYNNFNSFHTKERINHQSKKANTKSSPKNINKVGNKCHFCGLYITSNAFLTYIFDASDQKDMRKSGNRKMRDSPKIICSACLNRDYDKCDGMPKTLGDNDFLVIKNNVQMIYKKKVNRVTEDFKPMPKLLNTMAHVKEERVEEMGESYIVKKEDGCFDIIGDPSKDQVDRHLNMVIKIENGEDVGDNDDYLYSCRLCSLKYNQLPLVHSLEHILVTGSQEIYPCVLCEFGKYPSSDPFQPSDTYLVLSYPSMRESVLIWSPYSKHFILYLFRICAGHLPTSQDTLSQPTNYEHLKSDSQHPSWDPSIAERGKRGGNTKGYTSYGELVEHMRAEHRRVKIAGKEDGRDQEGMELLQRVLEGQRGTAGSGEWLDEGTGVFLSISRKEDTEKEIQLAQDTDRKDADSDSESGVWIVQADDIPVEHVQLDNSGEQAGTVLAPRMFQCAVCKKRYSSPERLARHVCNIRSQKSKRKSGDPPTSSATPDATGDAQHTCTMCQQTFHTKIRFQFHTRHLHCNSSARPILRCSACPGLTFPSEAELYDHIHFSHPRVRRHRCTQDGCQREFLLKASLTTHLRCHAGERSHRCEECGKKFLDRQTLTEHRVTHLKVKPFQCHICLKYLNRRSRLRMHLLTHQSEPTVARVLACQHCNMAFKDQAQAETHINDSGECSENIDSNPDDPVQNKESAPSENKDAVNVKGQSSNDSHNGLTQNKSVSNGKQTRLHLDRQGQDSDLDHEDSDHNMSDELNSKSKSNNRQCRLNQVRGWRSAEGEPTKEEMLASLSDKAKLCIAVVEIDKAYRCEYCERVYSSQQSLNLHRGSHQGQRNPFICHVCGATFTTYSRCTTHKTTHGFYRSRAASTHSEAPAPPLYDNFPVVKHFLCEVCGKSYLHWTYLQVHRRQKHSDNVHMYKCRSCGDEFPNSWGIAYHRKKVHGQSSGSAPSGESTLPTVEKFQYSCPECGAVLKTKAQLFLHRRAEHPPTTSPPKQGLFSCSLCDKRYITKVGLKGHMKTHELKEDGDRHHRCKECGKTFVHATGLNTHTRRVHMRETNFSCTQCGKAFYSVCDLQSHARRHTGERPFPCEACGRCFRTRSMRNEHLRIHTGERPFPCTVCGLAFRRSYALKSHQLIHQGGRKHACTVCARLFRLRAELNTHMRHTHGLEPDVYTADNGTKGMNVENCPSLHVNTGSTINNRDVQSTPDSTEINTLQNASNNKLTNVSQYRERSGSNAKVNRLPKKTGTLLNRGHDNGNNLMLENDIEIFTAIFDDGPQNDFGSETTVEMTDTVFLQNDDIVVTGGYILNDTEQIVGELSDRGGKLIVKGHAGDGRIVRVVHDGELLAVESDRSTSLKTEPGSGATCIAKEMVLDRYDVDIMEKAGEFVGWRGAEESAEGVDGSKSPDDTRRFNDLFRSHQ